MVNAARIGATKARSSPHLLESADTREAGQSPGELIPVKHAEISKAKWKLTVRADTVFEHDAMT